MRISQMCVGAMFTLCIVILTGLLGLFIGKMYGETGDSCMSYSWLFSSFGFGICLTIVLYTYGLIN